MPDRSEAYQLPSWPKTLIDRLLWNATMADIHARLASREQLEASFESLKAQGVQASLDYIQVNVAPQIANLRQTITDAQDQINQILVGSSAPNSLKFGNQLPAYYASAAALAEGLAGRVPIVGVVESLSARSLPAVVTDIRTGGFDTPGDLGGWPLAVEVPNVGTLEPWHRQTDGGTRRWELRADTVSVKMFGAKGDGVTDDSAAIRDAFRFWKKTGCTLVFPAGSYRVASSILVDMAGIRKSGSVIMEGSIKPHPGIGRAITIRNTCGGRFVFRVSGGGQTADYSQANPAGADEAFAFVNVYGPVIAVEGENYQGRMLRVTTETANIGPHGFKTQWVEIQRIYCNSTAKITDPEATRLAQGVGQAFFIDTGTNAFGLVGNVMCLWDLYGPVIENTADITLQEMESLWRGKSGLELRGNISLWGGRLKLGSELPANAPDLLRIINSSVETDGGATPRPGQNIRIEQIFAIGGNNNVVITDVGTASGQSVSIGYLNSRMAKNDGLQLNNTRKFNVHYESWGDYQGLHMTGACQDGDFYGLDVRASKTRAVYIEAGSDNIKIFGGSASDANQNAAADTSLVQIDSVGNIEFYGHEFSSGTNDYLLRMVSANGVKLHGGSMVTGGSTKRLMGQPNFAEGVSGLVVGARGQVSVSAGTTSLTIAHGLVKAPSWWDGRGNTGESRTATMAADSTSISVTFPAALAGTALFVWKAEVDFAGR